MPTGNVNKFWSRHSYQKLRGEGGAFKSEVPVHRKGRDIGYAPATSSCEGANSVDACTITALDVITAFAVPNPNGSSQSPSVFSGLVALQVALPNGSPSLLRSD